MNKHKLTVKPMDTKKYRAGIGRYRVINESGQVIGILMPYLDQFLYLSDTGLHDTGLTNLDDVLSFINSASVEVN